MKIDALLEAKEKKPKWEDNLSYKPNLWGHKDLTKALDEVLAPYGMRTDGMKRSTIWITFPTDRKKFKTVGDVQNVIERRKFHKVLAKFNLVFDDYEEMLSAWRDGGDDFKILVQRADGEKPIPPSM